MQESFENQLKIAKTDEITGVGGVSLVYLTHEISIPKTGRLPPPIRP